MITDIQLRSKQACEICLRKKDTQIYLVSNAPSSVENAQINCCTICISQIEKTEPMDSFHWQCIANAMWSEISAVVVVCWRMLNRFKNQTWAADLLDMIYIDDTDLEWAMASQDHIEKQEALKHVDTNGAILQNGDSVVIIKDLHVKGSSLTAKIGTTIKNIRLDPDDADCIEGKIEGQLLVVLTKFVKKQA